MIKVARNTTPALDENSPGAFGQGFRNDDLGCGGKLVSVFFTLIRLEVRNPDPTVILMVGSNCLALDSLPNPLVIFYRSEC